MNPPNSRNRNKTDLFSVLNEEINSFKEKGTVLIQGDLDARIGQHDDFISFDKFNKVLENANVIHNGRGKDLLDFCKANVFLIVNWRKIGDIFGKYTSHQWNGTSVVDYLITPNKNLIKILNFTVVDYLPWLSDHCPIHTIIYFSKLKLQKDHLTRKYTDKHSGYTWAEKSKEKCNVKL